MRSELVPTLEEPSVIPSLADARRHAEDSFRALAETVLTAIERYDHPLRADQLPEVRKLLCVSIGKIHAFLRDTFGEIVANDPRSRHDADYFLSRRFAQDIEESEWLYSSVYELDELLDGLEKAWSAEFTGLLPRMRRERMIPPEPDWEQTRKLLDILLGDLMPKLRFSAFAYSRQRHGIARGPCHTSRPSAGRSSARGRQGCRRRAQRVGAPTLDDEAGWGT
jgi:hypothetical protein